MNIHWRVGSGGPWYFMYDGDFLVNYLIEFCEDGKVKVEYNLPEKWTEIARFDTEKEAKAYAEVCYRMGVKHED